MNDFKSKWVFLSIIVATVVLVVFSVNQNKVKENINIVPDVVSTSTSTTTNQNSNYTPYGKVNLKVGEIASFPVSNIKLIRVFDDSRCPIGVTCIWAGTLKVELAIFDGKATTTHTIEIGKSFKTKTESISFVSATPYPKQGTSILEKDYVIVFDVVKVSVPVVQPIAGKCFVGGCSGEVCSDKSGVVSNCMYRPDYGCYVNAKCERQTDGQCGWTKTEELKACLQTATM